MSLLDVLMCGLAAWRLAYLLTSERGMFGLGALIRRVVGVQMVTVDKSVGSHAYSVPECEGGNEIAKMLCCVYCTGVWTAALVLLCWMNGLQVVVYLLAIAALVIFAEKANRYV